jgi:hypothetical protein
MKGLSDFSNWFEVKETDSTVEKIGKGIGSWGAGIVAAIYGMKILSKAVRGAIAPFAAIFKKLLGINSQIKKATSGIKGVAEKGTKTAGKAKTGSGLGSGFKPSKENLKASGKGGLFSRAGLGRLLSPLLRRGAPMSMVISDEDMFNKLKEEKEKKTFMDYIRESNKRTFQGLEEMGYKKSSQKSVTNNFELNVEVNESKEDGPARFREELDRFAASAL